MFATNARLLGRTFEYDGNPHTFADNSQVRGAGTGRRRGVTVVPVSFARVQRQRAEREAAASDFAAFGHDASAAPHVDPAESLSREQALLAAAAAASQRRAAKEAAAAAAAALTSSKEPKRGVTKGAPPSMPDIGRTSETAAAAGPADPKIAPLSRGAKRSQRRRRLQDASTPAAQAGGSCTWGADAGTEAAGNGTAVTAPSETRTAPSETGSFQFDVPSIIAAMAL